MKKRRSNSKRRDENGDATNVHHRHSRNTGGSSHAANLSRVSVREHHAYNLMFDDGHMHPKDIARKLTEVWISPEWEIIARKKGDKPCATQETPHQSSDAPIAKESIASDSGLKPRLPSCTNCTVGKSKHSTAVALIALAQQLLDVNCVSHG